MLSYIRELLVVQQLSLRSYSEVEWVIRMSDRSRILILNRWPQYPNGERWDNGPARPDALIDYRRRHVTYICDATGKRGVPEHARFYRRF